MQAFVKIIREMVADRKACEEMGRNARQLILDQFTREYGTSRYVDIIRKVIENGRNWQSVFSHKLMFYDMADKLVLLSICFNDVWKVYKG